MIRLFAADVDGTLLNEKSKLEEETVAAIRRFQMRGGHFMIATGRNPFELENISDRIDGAIINCINGALLCKQNGELLASHFLGEEEITRIGEYCQKKGICVEFHGLNRTFSFQSKEFFLQRGIPCFVRHFHQDPEELFELIFKEDFMCFAFPLEKIRKEKIAKIEVLFLKEEEKKELKEMLKKELSGCRFTSVSSMENLEITAGSADKGLAVEWYCQKMGIHPDEVAVVGDSGNDIPMLKRFTHSYAMGNADEETKKAASLVILSNREKGVAKLLQEICDSYDEENDEGISQLHL